MRCLRLLVRGENDQAEDAKYVLQDWILLILGGGAAASVIGLWRWQAVAHVARLRRIPIRVHVNGIRGKSTITRYVASALRAGGIETLAKTTGSDTRIIHPDGSETPIRRRGAPTILEQIDVLRREHRLGLGALVFECMALRPEYQRVSERRMIRATDGIVANVRRDHVEQLGTTLPEIARSLAATAPAGAPLYTAETEPELREILGDAAEARGGWLVTVSGDDLSEAERQGFSPLDFPENIALALAVAQRHGVARDVALDGIRAAQDDPGASKIHRHHLDGRTLLWIDLFGVNDVESAEMNIARISDWIGAEDTLVFVINNRADRQDRSVQFAEMAARHAGSARIALVGEAVSALGRAIAARRPDLSIATPEIPEDAAPAKIAGRLGDGAAERLVLVGLANIHTIDATRLIAALETPRSAWSPETERAA